MQFKTFRFSIRILIFPDIISSSLLYTLEHTQYEKKNYFPVHDGAKPLQITGVIT